jgi:predicted dehydrogenase
VGVGHLGRHHARLLAAQPGVVMVGVADLVAERAQAVTAEPLAQPKRRRGGKSAE